MPELEGKGRQQVSRTYEHEAEGYIEQAERNTITSEGEQIMLLKATLYMTANVADELHEMNERARAADTEKHETQ